MPTSTPKHAASTNAVFRAFAILSIFGIAGLAVTAMLAFEEPNSTLLLFSSILVFATPVAMFVHLTVTKGLTQQEKRIWIQELTSRRAAWAWSEYLNCNDHRATAKRFAAEALARRRAKNDAPSPPAATSDTPSGPRR